MTTILVVEDEPAVRADITEELRSSGYDVLEAANGDEGLTAIATLKPDLVLSDINMPAMDGPEMMLKMRRHLEDAADIPFVFLTAYSDPKHMVAGLEAGADDYLPKPVDFDILLAKIKSILRRVDRDAQKKEIEHVKLYKALTEPSCSTSPAVVSRRIVLVGSDGREVSEVSAILKQQGHDPILFESGKAFVQAVGGLEADVVFIWFYTTDMQAPMAAKLAKNKIRGRAVPFILIWPADMERLDGPTKSWELDDVLMPPLIEQDLIAKVAELTEDLPD